MFEAISTFISKFMQGSRDEVILIILILMISIFFLITVSLFIVTIYLRFSTLYKNKRNKWRSKKWDPVILEVMDGLISAEEGFNKLKWQNSIEYLLHLELYVDMLKGKEKERLLILGRLSHKKLHHLIQSRNRRKQLYGVHLLGLFHPKDQYRYLRFNPRDIELSLTMIREMRTIDNFRVKERLIKMLFIFKYISPVYISNILVEMGEDIVPILRMLILERQDHPYEQVVAIETIRRMHYSGCLDIFEKILRSNKHPMVLASSLKYMEEMGDNSKVNIVKPFLSHPHPQVRIAAVDAYVSLSSVISVADIHIFFNDTSVQVAVSAAKKLQMENSLPFISFEDIEQFKWADIYKRMVY